MVEIDQCLGKSKDEEDWSKTQKELCKSNDSKEEAMKCMQKSKSSSNFQVQFFFKKKRKKKEDTTDLPFVDLLEQSGSHDQWFTGWRS